MIVGDMLERSEENPLSQILRVVNIARPVIDIVKDAPYISIVEHSECFTFTLRSLLQSQVVADFLFHGHPCFQRFTDAAEMSSKANEVCRLVKPQVEKKVAEGV
jgi:hypothetical protein